MGWARYTLNKKDFYFKMTRELIAFSQYMSTYFPKKKIFVFNMVKLHYLLNFKYQKCSYL